MSFSTNMTAAQILDAHRQQQLRELQIAKSMRDQWQAAVDRLEGATKLMPESIRSGLDA